MFEQYVFNNYGFDVLWNPDVMTITIIALIAYFTLIGPFRDLFQVAAPVPLSQKVLFVTGMLLFYLALGSPLHVIGDRYLFSAHIFQQGLAFMFVPPLLLLGTPQWLLRSLLKWEPVKKFFQFVTRPLTALILFNGLFSLYHFPIIFDAVSTNDLLHNTYHTILFFTAFLMWWPILSPLPEWKRLSELLKMAYIIGNAILLYPACALIIFANSTLYQTYADAPQLISILSTLRDQQLGGILMKVTQEIALGSTLAYIFFQWVRREKLKDIKDDFTDSDEPARAQQLFKAKEFG